MTSQELSRHDGREGRKAYIAVNGTIFDVTSSKLWQNGDHIQQHQAGRDLTEELKTAPHVRAVVERFPVVDRLEGPAPAAKPSRAPLIVGGAVALVLILLFLLLR